MKAKILRHMMMLVVLLGILTTGAWAVSNSGTCGPNLTWTYTDGVLTITGDGEMYSYSNNAPWGTYRDDIKTVRIQEGVTSIGDDAFLFCSKLTDVTIPESVTKIGTLAFASTALTDMEIPDSVTSIGYSAFSGCDELVRVTIPGSVTDWGKNVFYACSSLTDVTLSDGITELPYGIFCSCLSLSEITIPDSVTRIETDAFRNCSALKDIDFGKNVAYIGDMAFSGCTSLTSLIIPDSVTEIAQSAFENCSSLVHVTVPNSVTRIGGHVFQRCTALRSIDLPDHITSIESCNFVQCTSLARITIPESVTTIGDSAFGQCTALTSVTIPDSVTTIDANAFSGCTNITDLKVGRGVTSIGKNSFSNCPQLSTITFYGDAPSFGSPVFGAITAAAYYPRGNTTWNADTCKDYGAEKISWYASCLGNHDPVTDPAVAPTCTSPGKTEGSHCSFCDAVLKTQQEIPVIAHSLTRTEAKAATCTAAGNHEYYTCGKCSKYFSDAAGEHEIAQNSWVIKKKDHTPQTVAGKAATCTEPGLTAGSKCAVCDTVLTEQATLPALGHAPVIDQAAAATCTKPGKTEGSHCSRCNAVITEQKPVPALGHTPAAIAGTPATCTTPGRTTGSYCSVCSEVIAPQREIPAKGHDLQHHDAVEPACKQDGSKEYWSCTACGLLFADEAGTIETTEEELVIRGLPHAWSEASYVWTETAEGYACTGSVYCLRDGCEYYPQSKPMTEEATVTMAVKTAPTCTAAGEAVYTASFTNNKIATATKTVEIPAKGHTEVVDAAVPATCTEAGKTEGSHCSVCNEILVAQTEVAALGHDYVETARVDATETAAGSVTYTCSRCHDSYTETIAEIACPSAAYTDVPAYGNWAHAGIDYCVANGLMNGMSANRFDPKGTLTRAQLVTILYRVAGQPEPTTSGTFTDLTANWYKKAVEWAAANGIVKGYPDGTFRPDEAITREQIATILYRFDEATKAEENKLAGFPDAADVSGWAAEGLNWAVNEGLINGAASQGTSYLQPKATATRDQIAAIIMRYLNSK